VLPGAQLKIREDELREKRARVLHLLATHEVDGIWLTRSDNIEWLTGGMSEYDSQATERLIGLLITEQAVFLLVDRQADRSRLAMLEAALGAQVCETDNDASALNSLLAGLAGSNHIGTDRPRNRWQQIGGDIARLMRRVLTATEQYRYRALCRDSTAVLQSVGLLIMPGQSEKDIAAEIAQRSYQTGIKPTTILVSADSGIRHNRHPLPGDNAITRYAILVLSGKRAGLNVTLTRIVAVEKMSSRFERKHRIAAYLSALCMHYARPGRTLPDVVQTGQAAFQVQAAPRQWQARFQAGLPGYGMRQIDHDMHIQSPIAAYQPVAWATSINGIRSENSYLVLPDRTELLTHTENWPVFEIRLNDWTYYQPDILRL